MSVCVCVWLSVRLVHLIDIGTVSIDFSRRLSVSFRSFRHSTLNYCVAKANNIASRRKKTICFVNTSVYYEFEQKKKQRYLVRISFNDNLSTRPTIWYPNLSHIKNLCILNHFQMSLCFRNVAHHISSFSVFLCSLYLIPLSPLSLTHSLSFFFSSCLFLFEKKNCLFDSFITSHTNIQAHIYTKMKSN